MTRGEKKSLTYEQMTDAELNFQQCSLLSEFHFLLIFVLHKHPFIPRLSFLLKELDFLSYEALIL